MIKDEIYKFFADFIYKRTGIFYPEKDFYRLDSRLNTLVSQFEAKDVDDIYTMFKTNPSDEMIRFLTDICTNNETYFFRDTKPFAALTEEIIPEMIEAKKSSMINIWSCASSTGQEPLSILMSIKESPIASKVNVSLSATDISLKVLDKAKSGIYTGLEVQRGLPVQLMVKYFESVDDGKWKAKNDLLAHVKYSEFNLFSENFPLNKYDVIFCRNVLIYQDSENKNKILQKLEGALVKGGYLVMGAGESLIGTQTGFTQATKSGTMVFKKS